MRIYQFALLFFFTLTSTVVDACDITLSIEEKICENQYFVFGSDTLTSSGQYFNIFQVPAGCDSTVYLDLTVVPSISTYLAETICEGTSFAVDTMEYVESGNYVIPLTSLAGCDSTVYLDLTVVPSISTYLAETICEGTSFAVDTMEYVESGSYVIPLTSLAGCDSTVYLDLTVVPSVSTYLTETICEGTSFVVDTMEYEESGSYVIPLTSLAGCDSTVYLDLTVVPSISTYLAETICEGTSFAVDLMEYVESGSYVIPLTSLAGCDSTVYLDLNVVPSVSTYLTETICEGTSFAVDTMEYVESGSYVIPLTSLAGCDSTVYLDLTVVPSVSTYLTETICEGTSFAVDTMEYVESGSYVIPLTSLAGCDSTVYLDLNVLTVKHKNINVTICEGQSYVVGDQEFSTEGLYSVILTGTNGCDSIVNLQLDINPTIRRTIEPVICEGESFQVGTKIYSKSGIYIDTLVDQFYCDSIVTTILDVKQVSVEQIAITICEGQSYTVGQNTYTQEGLYRDTLSSIYGCDSIVNLRLLVKNQLFSEQKVMICEGDSFHVGDNIYTVNGTYYDTLISSGGCDSIVTTVLTVHPNYQSTFEKTICEGDSIVFGNEVITTEGIYTQLFATQYSCDSLVTLNVNVLSKDYEQVRMLSCVGEKINIEGVDYMQDTTFSLVFNGQLGCDSIVEYQLEFYPTYNEVKNTTVCKGDTYEGVVIERDTIFTFNLTSIYGCDSTVTINVKAAESQVTYTNQDICYGDDYYGMRIERDTILTRHLSNQYGCDSIIVDTIFVLPLPQMSVSSDTTIEAGSWITLFARGASSYEWSTGDTGSYISVQPQTKTTYTVIGKSNGCQEKKSITISINTCEVKDATYFTPNGDGKHDFWKLRGLECLVEFNLKILNRSGSIVFETNSIEDSWDGNYNSKPTPEGVYFYILEGIAVENASVFRKNGYIHLMR